MKLPLILISAVSIFSTALLRSAESNPPLSLFALAQQHTNAHRYSTLMTAQDVRDRLSKPEGLREAISWCKQTGVTKVYLECFRDGYRAERSALENAKRSFQAEGILTSGCVTPTRVGKPSTGWKDVISCYTDASTLTNVQSIFEYAAGLFDETMIDDFWFTDCTCPQCDTARKSKEVTVLGQRFPVNGDSWEEYRCELMVQISRKLVLGAGKRVNPRATFIIKYPQWYDRFHERGYEVLRETSDFDRIWVGTETRDYADQRWGGTPQYEAFFIMRWLGGLGGPKCGGGWFDPYGTTEQTYLEQARQTILGGAAESVLFCYGSLLGDTGPANIRALRENLPELLSVAEHVRGKTLTGIAAYKPANSHPETEPRIFDFVGMLGLPLVPCHEFPQNAPAAFFSLHALKDPALETKLTAFIKTGKPVLLTDGLAARLPNLPSASNVYILKANGDPKTLLNLPEPELDRIREPLLKAFGTRLSAPNRVGFYLFTDGSWVIENFNDESTTVHLDGADKTVPSRGWFSQWRK